MEGNDNMGLLIVSTYRIGVILFACWWAGNVLLPHVDTWISLVTMNHSCSVK